MGDARRGGRDESAVKRAWDGLVLRHPVISPAPPHAPACPPTPRPQARRSRVRGARRPSRPAPRRPSRDRPAKPPAPRPGPGAAVVESPVK